MIRLFLGFWLMLIGLDLAPEIWSGRWWVLVVGLFIAASGAEYLLKRRDGGGDS